MASRFWCSDFKKIRDCRSISDFDGPIVTESVYSQLFGNSLASKFDGARAAKALHIAVSGLRGQGKHVDFIRWVPFIHVGL